MLTKMFRHVDYFFNKLLPKKFLVWVIASFFCFNGKISGDLWAYISMIYMGANVLAKIPYIMDQNKIINKEQ